MIDDFTEVKELIGKMQATLPIHVMREQGVKVKSKHELLIEKVVYLGDEGGIACALKLPGYKEKVFITSLTHLRVKTNHPLAKDIQAYQIKRTKKLAQ